MRRIIGLRNATEKEIEDLKKKYPKGEHRLFDKRGKSLPYNGVFVTVR